MRQRAAHIGDSDFPFPLRKYGSNHNAKEPFSRQHPAPGRFCRRTPTPDAPSTREPGRARASAKRGVPPLVFPFSRPAPALGRSKAISPTGRVFSRSLRDRSRDDRPPAPRAGQRP
ncbi:hypothetical protein NY78_0922 [Desulfovibrio sp. TomC]|nr:hypothetical protein NY78_0922 [Desulfovibrio sp. TomC]